MTPGPGRALSLAVLLLVGGSSRAADPSCPVVALWPTQGWLIEANDTGAAHLAAVAALESYAFTLTGKEEARVGIRTDAVLIVHQGKIIYEKYGHGWNGLQRHEGWSVAKSVSATLLGIAVQRGAMTLEDSICKSLPSLPAKSCGVKVGHLREFASGFDFSEVYENRGNQASSTIAMLYGEGHADMAGFVANHTLSHPPGTWFNYSSGDATLLAATVDGALLPSLGKGYPWTLLFNPLGMTSAVFERDLESHLVGGAYFYATARDYAKLGYLWRHDGCWTGQRLLPSGYMRDSVQVTDAYRANPESDGVQGRQFWINVAVADRQIKQPWPDAPADAFSAIGHWGQYVTVIPSRDLIIVRLGDDRDDTFDLNRFLKLALAVSP